jgi:UDP-2,3-diacylglucosamine hydrolase
MKLAPGKKVYFASDQHLGVPTYESSLKREKHFVKWLTMVQKDAAAIFVLGDLFDFWFEYKHAVPRGHVRVLGKLAEIADAGIPIYFFTGNHDMWTFDYLSTEIGLKVFREPIEIKINDAEFYIGHGDGLGPGDNMYKLIKKVFASPFLQWCFARLHPNFGIGLANYFSRSSRAKNATSDKEYYGDDKEMLVVYSKELLTQKHYDYLVFGHRHYAQDLTLQNNARYINLGDWVIDFTYAVFDGQHMELKEFGKPE